MITTATIAVSGTKSQALALDGPIVGLVLPAAFTGTAISFEVSVDGGATFAALYDGDGALVSVPVAQGHATQVEPTTLVGYPTVKLVSNATETAQRAVAVVSRPV